MIFVYIAIHSVVKLIPLREKPGLVAPRQRNIIILTVMIERTVDKCRTANEAEALQIKESVLGTNQLCINKFKSVLLNNIGFVEFTPCCDKLIGIARVSSFFAVKSCRSSVQLTAAVFIKYFV